MRIFSLTLALAACSHPAPTTVEPDAMPPLPDAATITPPTGPTINALIPNLAAPPGGCAGVAAGTSQYCDFIQFVAPHIDGASMFLYWRQIDHGAAPCVEGSATHPCDWTAFDARVADYVAAGLGVGLIVIAVNEGGAANLATPDYVFAPSYATSLGAPPQDMAVCNLWPGGAASPVHGSPTVKGVWNHDACSADGATCSGAPPYSDTNGFPVVYEKPFMTAYQGFIANVIAHYSATGTGRGPALAASIAYMRFGMTGGGESQLYCSAVWPGRGGLAAEPGAYSGAQFLGSAAQPGSGYISSMLASIRDRHPTIPALINTHNGPPANLDFSYSDAEAAMALANQLGFGMEALGIDDPAHLAKGERCSDNWCANFDGARTAGVPLVLQTTIPTLQPEFALASLHGDGTTVTATCTGTCDFYSMSTGYVQIVGTTTFDGTYPVATTPTPQSFTFASTVVGDATAGAARSPDFLPTSVPFAAAHGATTLEIYLCDLLYAFDPHAIASATCSTPPGAYSDAYAALLRRH